MQHIPGVPGPALGTSRWVKLLEGCCACGLRVGACGVQPMLCSASAPPLPSHAQTPCDACACPCRPCPSLPQPPWVSWAPSGEACMLAQACMRDDSSGLAVSPRKAAWQHFDSILLAHVLICSVSRLGSSASYGRSPAGAALLVCWALGVR